MVPRLVCGFVWLGVFSPVHCPLTCILLGCDGDWDLLIQHGRLRFLVASSNGGKISLYAEKHVQKQKTNPAHESEDNNKLVYDFG